MIASLRCIRTWLRLPPRRFLSEEVAFGKTDFSDIEGRFDADVYPEIIGNQLQKKLFIVGRITKWLHCSPKQAQQILTEVPSLMRCHLDSVEDYMNFMMGVRIDRNLIAQNAWLMDYSLSTMRERIIMLSQVGISQDTIQLLRLDTKDLEKIVQVWMSEEKSGKYNQNGNRLTFFSKELQCSAEHLANLMKKNCSLMIHDFDQVSSICSLLLDSGFTPTDIQRHLSVFQLSLEYVKNRLEAAHLANAAITLHMIVKSENTFDELLESKRNTGERQAVNVVNILMEKLSCEHGYALSLTKRVSRLQGLSPNRLNQMLDLLLEFGFTSREICFRPILLVLPLKTVQGRLQECKKLGIRPSVGSIIFTNKRFKSYILQLNAKT